MNIRFFIMIVTLFFLSSGCFADSKGSAISGTVLDAETGKPIEGAVVLVEWTKTKGLGNTYTESYKVIEVLSDKEGKFTVKGISDRSVNLPDVTVYKKSYVCWSSRLIFPDRRNRTDFKWGGAYTFRLEHFKPEYSYDEHTSFIHSVTNASLGSKKELIEKAYRWEEVKASDELDEKWRKHGIK